MVDIDPKSERNGILGSIVIHALLFVAFYFIESKPEPVDQLGYIQVEFGEFAEGRPVQSVPESVPEPTPPPEEPELEEAPEEIAPEDSKPVDLPDAEPIEEPEIQSPDTETEAIVPEETQEEPDEEDQEERPAEVKPLGSGVTDNTSGAESGDDGSGNDAEQASPVFIEGLERDLMSRILPPNSAGVNADAIVEISVGPDGTVKKVDYVRKSGNAQLDLQVMIAVRKWKFNELPPNAPQELQTGRVTFKFRVD